ncbi:MAG: SAM hydrolase/SAM-dependent halogenase family protein [Verrucomicrobiia bacterium]
MQQKNQPIITLTTDFGTRDWFVGTMKGVILSIAPNAKIVDITHEIPPGDIKSGAFALFAAYSYFPENTIHIAVVDPGVGSNRKPIAVKTNSYWFIAPDNGVLSYALINEEIKDIRLIENEKFLLKPLGNTFHGRDVFAPAAAHIATGISGTKIGKKLTEFLRLEFPKPIIFKDRIEGEIIYIDRFGNAITNIKFKPDCSYYNCQVYIDNRPVARVRRCYADVQKGKAVAVPGSSGFIEIAVRDGNAANNMNLKVGKKILLRVLE